MGVGRWKRDLYMSCMLVVQSQKPPRPGETRAVLLSFHFIFISFHFSFIHLHFISSTPGTGPGHGIRNESTDLTFQSHFPTQFMLPLNRENANFKVAEVYILTEL